MLENNFASIGKSVLIHAIGIQDNYKISHELDRKASGCFSCPNLKASLKQPTCAKCSACPNRKFKDDAYVNEKNRYGYQPSLSMCSIKLFTYLHFFVTGSGVIEDLQIREAAEKLHMSSRSIHNSLKYLQQNDYIVYQKNYPGSYFVVLNQFEDYFKKANEGGRGYLIFSRDFFHDVIAKATTVNELRLSIRMYLNIDEKKYYPIQPYSYLTDSRKITDICRYFPHYVKPVHVRDMIRKISSVFTVRQDEGAVIYSLNQNYFGELQKNSYKDDCKVLLEEQLSSWNQVLETFFDRKSSITALPDHLVHHVVTAKVQNSKIHFHLSDKDMEDLLQLSVQYGYERMLIHLQTVLKKERSFSSLSGHYGEYVRISIEGSLCAA